MRYQCGGFEVVKVTLGGVPSSCQAILVVQQIGERLPAYNNKGKVYLDESGNTVQTVYKSQIKELVKPIEELSKQFPIGTRVYNNKIEFKHGYGIQQIWEVTGYAEDKLVCKTIGSSNESTRTLVTPQFVHTYEDLQPVSVQDVVALIKAGMLADLDQAIQQAESRQCYNDKRKPSGHMRGLLEAIDIVKDYQI